MKKIFFTILTLFYVKHSFAYTSKVYRPIIANYQQVLRCQDFDITTQYINQRPFSIKAVLKDKSMDLEKYSLTFVVKTDNRNLIENIQTQITTNLHINKSAKKYAVINNIQTDFDDIYFSVAYNFLKQKIYGLDEKRQIYIKTQKTYFIGTELTLFIYKNGQKTVLKNKDVLKYKDILNSFYYINQLVLNCKINQKIF